MAPCDKKVDLVRCPGGKIQEQKDVFGMMLINWQVYYKLWSLISAVGRAPQHVV